MLTLLCALACSRPTPNLPTEAATHSTPSPFQSERGGLANAVEGPSASGDQGGGPAFRNSDVIPGGSLLTVRLKVPLLAGNGLNESFEAVLDEPVMVEGNPVIARDATVSGEIESAHPSKTGSDRGYLRLALNSVQVDGVSVRIQTASLFVRQPTSAVADSVPIGLEKGRRLTFRLKEQVFLHSNPSKCIR